jgi:hypothetical protein
MSKPSLGQSASSPRPQFRQPKFPVVTVFARPLKPSVRVDVCQRCGSPLGNPWRSGGQLCWQCGIDHELFRPETRWMDEGDGVQPPPTMLSRLPWWRRVFGYLRKARPVLALRSLTLLAALYSVLLSSAVRADDCSDALVAEGCACQSTVPSNQERLATPKKARKTTPSLGNARLDRLRHLEERVKTRVAAQ